MLGALLLTGIITAVLSSIALFTPVRRTVIASAIFFCASVVRLPVTRRWNARAHLCWASCVLLFVAYLAFILVWTVGSGLGPLGSAGGLVL